MPVSYKKLLPLSRIQGFSKGLTLVGVWTNELESQMTVTAFDEKFFSGSYRSAVSASGKSAAGTLSGTVAGDAIVTVNWIDEFESVTAWTGLLLGDEGQVIMYTVWQMASTPKKEENFWQSINAGADIFVQQDAG